MRLVFKINIVVFCFLALTAHDAGAQKLSVKNTIDRKKIVIGDWIKYNLEISNSKNVLVIWPYIPDTFGNFEVISRTAIDSSMQSGNFTRKQTITITSFDSGTHTLPSFDVLFRKSNDTNILKAQTDSFLVTVNVVAVDTSKAMRPIKPPLKLPLKLSELVPYLLILTGMLIISFLLYYFIRKRKKRPVFERPVPVIPPHITATEKLKRLEEQKLWQKGEVKKYHVDLTDIVREYIELRFDFPALESVTDEIIENTSKVVKDAVLVNDLRWSLELSDLVKFAKSIPLPDDNDRCMRTAYQFVEKTIPVEKNNEPVEEKKQENS